MKVGDLIDYLRTFNVSDEGEIEVCETITGEYVDSSAAVTISKNELTFGPILKIDVEAGKFRAFL